MFDFVIMANIYLEKGNRFWISSAINNLTAVVLDRNIQFYICFVVVTFLHLKRPVLVKISLGSIMYFHSFLPCDVIPTNLDNYIFNFTHESRFIARQSRSINSATFLWFDAVGVLEMNSTVVGKILVCYLTVPKSTHCFWSIAWIIHYHHLCRLRTICPTLNSRALSLIRTCMQVQSRILKWRCACSYFEKKNLNWFFDFL